MMVRLSGKWILVLLAASNLLAAQISACTCTHHKETQTERTAVSCHGATHEETSVETSGDDSKGPRLGEQCICYLDRAQTAIVAKSEQKKFKTQHTDKAESKAAAESGYKLIPIAEVALVHPDLSFYLSELPRSGPSRAPPRL
jgi:hypothetical protein